MTSGFPQKKGRDPGGQPLSAHPAWVAFIQFCLEMKYGEIERLLIQDGLPVMAELTKKKVKFNT